MKKILLLTLLIGSTTFLSCKKKDEANPDNGAAVAGTYRMKTYVTETGASPTPLASGNNLVVTRIDNNNAKVVIDYADPKSSDVTLDKMNIIASNGNYNLEQVFKNGTGKGTISGNDFSFQLNYVDPTTQKSTGDFVTITATK